MHPRERLQYVISQTARMLWFTGHYITTRRLERATGRLRPSKPSAQNRLHGGLVRRALLNGAIDLVRRDFSSIDAGHFSLPRDMLPNPVEAIRDLVRYYRDLPRAQERRRADVARVLRAAVVSTVYAASGSSLMAPVLASLGVLGARAEGVKGE